MQTIHSPISTQTSHHAKIALREGFGWRRHVVCEMTIWTKGWGRGTDAVGVARYFRHLDETPDIDSICKWLLGLDGHFAVVIGTPNWTFAAVDRVRSIPLAWSAGNPSIIDDQAERLRACLGTHEIDPDAALALGMAGYTIDAATLYRDVHQLGPGEFVLIKPGAAPQQHRYYCYRPWRADKPSFSFEKACRGLAATTLEVIDAMMRSIGDRILVVPLSAGRDSRLIVSAAYHLGYRNIRTFAYGHPGNHEASTSRAIAERLGFPWRFVPVSVTSMRRHFASSVYASYLDFADTLQSVPFVQDLPQLMELKRQGYVPQDAVIANGNSGDYISGNHVVSVMRDVPKDLDPDQRRRRIRKALLAKHFCLWANLCTSDRMARIDAMLDQSLQRAGAELADPRDDYGLYEYVEFQDRQCKYVIGGQRIYEFLEHEWRLPLWDRSYLDFFEAVPLEGKGDQRLYAQTLQAENWGGVWQNLPVNKREIRPHWIRPVRWLSKAFYAPLGRDKWRKFERRYLHYWMENGSHSAVYRYRDVASDSRGARHGIAWLAEAYLVRHGCHI